MGTRVCVQCSLVVAPSHVSFIYLVMNMDQDPEIHLSGGHDMNVVGFCFDEFGPLFLERNMKSYENEHNFWIVKKVNARMGEGSNNT